MITTKSVTVVWPQVKESSSKQKMNVLTYIWEYTKLIVRLEKQAGKGQESGSKVSGFNQHSYHNTITGMNHLPPYDLSALVQSILEAS